MKNCNEIMRGERAELSKKNPYYISKHRYYELKHFCRQYDEWKRALVRIDGWKAFPESTGAIVKIFIFCKVDFVKVDIKIGGVVAIERKIPFAVHESHESNRALYSARRDRRTFL